MVKCKDKYVRYNGICPFAGIIKDVNDEEAGYVFFNFFIN